MVLKISIILILLVLHSCTVKPISWNPNHNHNHNHKILNKNEYSLAGINFPDHPFNAGSDYDDNSEVKKELFQATKHHKKQSLKLHLKHKATNPTTFSLRDLTRIQTLHRTVKEKKTQNKVSRLQKYSNKPVVAPVAVAAPPEYLDSGGQLVATLESGVSLGSGEYFIDVFIGTPPKHFSLILDTGSDLNWIQCVPCYACFEQKGPFYNPKDSTSFRNITCHDPRCKLVSSLDPPQLCKGQNCQYFYWYGDSSNTTGDFALENFTVNLTNGKSELKVVENVLFGCGHWNRGLFHGASGLLGLGKGPLSFASQLRSIYGHSFSYCLVNRNSNSSVSSKLIFGENKELLNNPNLNFTSFVDGNELEKEKEKENPIDTFYYVRIKSIMVGGEVLNIPEETWNLSEVGGGTIIDSGTTLSYFSEPAYEIIKEAFMKRIKGYSIVESFLPLQPCYNVSGIEEIELPEFGILFGDGAIWDFPVENYFIQIESNDVICLAILGTPKSALSIIGNYQQQNFHILYDMKNSRLGFAPMNCADV